MVTPPYKLIGCIAQSPRPIAFYLPVYICTSEVGLFVQSTDIVRNEIVDFLELNESAELIINLPVKKMVSVGDSPLYVFNDGIEFSAGRRLDLKSIVENSLANQGSVALHLEWAELYGTPIDKRNARAAAVTALHSRHETGAKSFVTSLFLASLWDNVVSNLKPSTRAEEIAPLFRVMLYEADARHPDLLPESLWPILRPLITLEPQELRDRVLSELPDDFAQQALEGAVASEIQVEERNLGEAAARLRRIGRQEERVAIIMLELLERPVVGEFLLRSHKDRGKLARFTLERIRDNFASFTDAQQVELFFASMVQEMFTMSFTFTRGELLYLLARHLSKYPVIAHAIRIKLSDSHAFNVLQMRPLIEKELVKEDLEFNNVVFDPEQPELF